MSFLFPQIIWLALLTSWVAWEFYKKASTRVQRAKILIFNAVALLLVVALAQPVKPSGIDEVDIQGTEIVIALDLSASMRATDIMPSRLEAAKSKIKALIAASRHDRFAILGFTSSAIILSPMTDDKVLLFELFDRLNTDFIVSKSTKMQSVFDLATKLSLIDAKQLVMFSDGGDEDFQAEIALARAHTMRVYPVGMATTVGGTLKDDKGALLLDSQEHIVISALNGALKNLAASTGGVFFEAGFDPQELLDRIHDHASMVASKSKIEQTVPLFYGLAALALLLFMVGASSLVHKLFPVLLLVVLPYPSYAGVLDFYYDAQSQKAYTAAHYEKAYAYAQKLTANTWQVLYNQAHLLYKMGEYDQARATYERIATTSPELKAALFYNLGNCYAKLALFSQARSAYAKSLMLHRSQEALDNLAMITYLYDKPEMSNSGGQNAKDGTKDTKATQKGKKQEGSNTDLQQGQAQSGAGASKMNAKKRTLTPTPDKSVGLSSKQYQTINKGSYNEKNPW